MVGSGWWRLERAAGGRVDDRVDDRVAGAQRDGRYGGGAMARVRARGTTGQEHGLSA
jgi:hypothetical protein